MGGRNKQFMLVGGVPVLIKSALAFEGSPLINGIVIAAREEDIPAVRSLCGEYGVTKLRLVVQGGDTRAKSAANAFERACEAGLLSDGDMVMVHDGARPYVTAELIGRVYDDCMKYGSAVPVIPVKDTIKTADGEGFSAGTPDRGTLRAAQTPQAFEVSLYRRICGTGLDATDDGGLAELLGERVKLTDGDPRNIKITTPEDLPEPREAVSALRIGHGYDVHLLVPDRKLIIGGTEIPYELGLLGHSDADVLVHAVMDAMLGALALGDIGKHFPDSDPQYKGADSMELLRRVNAMIRGRGYEVSNLDCTISAEKPKLAPHTAQMRANIAAACGVTADAVSVKATTEEGLGLAGKGIGAVCVCLLKTI